MPPTKQEPSGPRTRVVLDRDAYGNWKEPLKAALKEHGLKWQFLGSGKGRYHKPGVHVFALFKDEGVDYTVWGDDEQAVGGVLDAWRGLLGEEAWSRALAAGSGAAKEDQVQEESEALRLWRLQEPQPRPGEPEFFLRKRREEWLARKP